MTSKYAPLGEYLRRQPMAEVPMSFGEIEHVTGVPLPPKAQNHAAWWSNNPSNNVMTKVWLAAGYKTERVDLSGRRLVFRRVKGKDEYQPSTRASSALSNGTETPRTPTGRHPILGALKGYVRVAPGVDLTEPADPSWERDT